MPPDAAKPTDQPIACPICSGLRLYYVFSAGEERVVRCSDCGLLATAPHDRGSAESGERAAGLEVATDDERATVIDRGVAPRALLAWLARYRGCEGGRLVQLGIGSPEFLRLAASRGFSVAAVDASPSACERARQALGSTGMVVEGALEDLPAGTPPFDVVVLDGALNQVRQPARLLETTHRWLAPQGTLVATAPGLAFSAGNGSGRHSDISTRPGCFSFEDRTLQSLLFRASYRRIISLPPLRGRTHVPRTVDPCAVIATPAPRRARPLLSVVFPAFNEAGTVADTLGRLIDKSVPGLDIEIVVVESNSTDGTREIVQRFASHPRVRLVLEERPRGKGRAVRTGLDLATGDFVLIQDADLEYDLEDYDVLLEPLLAGREAFVLGARHGGQTWKLRRFNDQPLQALVLNMAHWGFTFLINISVGLDLKDPFTMYKVFRRDCLHGLQFQCNRFDFDWELLLKLVRKGYRPIEIPVNYRSRSFKEGKKVSIFRDPLTWIVALVRSLTSPVDLLPPPPSR